MRTILAGYIHADNYQETLIEDGTLELVIEHVRQNNQVARDALEHLIRSEGDTPYTLYLETDAYLAIRERALQGRLFDVDGDGIPSGE